MFTAAAQRSCTGLESVATSVDLVREGWSDDEVRAQLAARRWQRHGRAVVLHGGSPTPAERRRVVLLNCGERALLTAFTTDQLRAALERAPRTRHRRQLGAALADIGQGAQAMSEIDFGRLCRHAGLPEPTRQAVRVGSGGCVAS